MRRAAPHKRRADGHLFDSLAELRRYEELKMLRAAGKVLWFLLQPRFELSGTTYRADFLIMWKGGLVTIEDVKPVRSARFIGDRFRKIQRQVEHLYGVQIEAVYR